MSKAKKVTAVETVVSLREAVQQLGLSPVWTRRQLTKKVAPLAIGAAVVDGKWQIRQTSIDAKLAQMAAKEAKREAIRSGAISYGYSRPSQKTVQMMRTKVAADDQLSDAKRSFVMSLLDRYEAEYAAAYEATKAKRS